jgi:hypothetical protein
MMMMMMMMMNKHQEMNSTTCGGQTCAIDSSVRGEDLAHGEPSVIDGVVSRGVDAHPQCAGSPFQRHLTRVMDTLATWRYLTRNCTRY